MTTPRGSLPGYDHFQSKLRQLTGIDLAAYKQRQMLRRLTGYLARVGMEDFFGLATLIDRDPEALERLKDFLTINVSEFFRNPERFADLKKKVLPDLLQRFDRLAVWSAGCSVGAESYSLSILLEELDPTSPHEIIGTDIDANILKTAETGVYRSELLKEVSPNRHRFFQSLPDDTWKVHASIQKRVRFRLHDLLRDPYPKGFHLVVCRNVVIYFTEEAKHHVYKGFSTSLVPGGYFMIGSTESIFNAGDYGLRPIGPFLYQKEGG